MSESKQQKPGESMKSAIRLMGQYNPNLELWWNGPLVWCFENCINSYRVLLVEQKSEHGFTQMSTKVADDLFIRNVLLLRANLLPEWRKRAEFQRMDEAIRRILHPATPSDGSQGGRPDFPSFFEAYDLYEAVVNLMNEMKVLKLRPPWNPAD